MEDCPCEYVCYEHPLDGACSHKACEGDMSLEGCGDILVGTPTSLEECPVWIAHEIARDPSLASKLLK